jgi:hypothetical protein
LYALGRVLALGRGFFLDQPAKGEAHRVVEVAIDKAAAAKLQPCNNTFKIDSQ